jgi:hypothetical protein
MPQSNATVLPWCLGKMLYSKGGLLFYVLNKGAVQSAAQNQAAFVELCLFPGGYVISLLGCLWGDGGRSKCFRASAFLKRGSFCFKEGAQKIFLLLLGTVFFVGAKKEG